MFEVITNFKRVMADAMNQAWEDGIRDAQMRREEDEGDEEDDD